MDALSKRIRRSRRPVGRRRQRRMSAHAYVAKKKLCDLYSMALLSHIPALPFRSLAILCSRFILKLAAVDQFEYVVPLVELDSVEVEKALAAEQNRHVGVYKNDRCAERLALVLNAEPQLGHETSDWLH